MIRRVSLLILLIGVVGMGAVALRSQHRDRDLSPPIAAHAQRPTVMALGRIEPVSEIVRVAGPAAADSGRIAAIQIKEGDFVEKGQVLAVLDTRPRLASAIQQAEATLALRRAALTKLIADLDHQERTLAAQLEQQETQRDRSKWDFERLAQLQQSGLYREPALIDKRLALDGANRALETARLLLERNRFRDAEGVRIDEAGARADVAVAEAALARARADHEFSAIRSPIAGRVLRRIGRLGEQIAPEGIAEIGDTRVMMVRAEVFESDARRVRIGAPVSVTSRALDEPLAGIVERIGLKVNRQAMIGEDPAASLDARVIEVLVRLDDRSTARAQGLTGLQVRVMIAPEVGS